MNKLYFLKDVVNITGINQPKLQQWLRDGYIKASHPGSGSGSRNQFTYIDLCLIKLFQRLTENGVSRLAAAKQIHTMPTLALWENDPEYSGHIVTYTDFASGTIGTHWVSTTEVNGLDRVIEQTISKERRKQKDKEFDLITIYNLKRIFKEINDGIAKNESL